MKRKFKLFATIASLCLCLALMAFGVYAASTVKYTASGRVSFEVSDVFVTMTSKLEATVGGAKATDVDDSHKSYTDTTSPVDTTEYSKEFEAVAFKKTGDNIVLTVTITNDGTNAVNVKFTVTKPESVKGLTSDAKFKNAGVEAEYTEAGFTLAKGATAEVALTIKLVDMQYTVGDTAFSVVANVAKA